MKVLFVHGALVRDGRWWWHRMVQPLAQRGLSTEALVLPSCEGAFGELKDMYTDIAAVSAAVAAADKPIILCGHSYGGAVITEAGADHASSPAATIRSCPSQTHWHRSSPTRPVHRPDNSGRHTRLRVTVLLPTTRSTSGLPALPIITCSISSPS